MYGPTFELIQNVPREPGSEEYLDSEKYQLRHWNLDDPNSLRDMITQVNHIRRENSALQNNWNLQFHATDNDYILCYSKHTPDYSNRVLVVVSIDPSFTQAGWVGVDLDTLGLDGARPFQVHDLLSGQTYTWQTSSWNYVELHPHDTPAHIFRIEQ
jgi:starch synthase (maltosyl-transferring)